MKQPLIIIFCVALSIGVNAQSKIKHHYWRVVFDYQTDCKYGSAWFTCDTKGNDLSYQNIYKQAINWVYPHKLISINITSFKKLIMQDTTKGNRFTCVFRLDTSRLIRVDTIRNPNEHSLILLK